MAMSHDCYLFNVDRFVQEAKQGLEFFRDDGKRENSISLLNQYFDEYETVGKLASHYGGWGKRDVEQELRLIESARDIDIGFMLIHVLYTSLEFPNSRAVCFWIHYRLLQNYLSTQGWTASDITLLIRGRTIKELAVRYLYSDDLSSIPSYWEHVEPWSMCESIGWLSSEDVIYLRPKIERELADLQTNFPLGDEEREIQSLLETALRITQRAQERKMSLCHIISG